MRPPVDDPDWLARWSVRRRLPKPTPYIHLGPCATDYLGVTARDDVYACKHRTGLVVFPAPQRQTFEGHHVTPPIDDDERLGRWSVLSQSGNRRPIIRLGAAAVSYLGLRPGDRVYGFKDPEGVRIVPESADVPVGGPGVPPPEGEVWP